MHLSLPANCQNQIIFAMASPKVAYPLALNVISGIMQKVVLMEQTKPSVSLFGKDPAPILW